MSKWKGIILAGGTGSRLYPITQGVSKQLVPVFDKPMIYYPLSLLMLAGIRDICLITTPDEAPGFKRLFGDGSHLGLTISYRVQETPGGLAQAFLIAEDFIGDANVALVLGDNILFGHGVVEELRGAVKKTSGATIFGYQVAKPKKYGVVEFDEAGRAISIEEKPLQPKSNSAVIGCYFYDNSVIEIAKSIKPSKRGELEITCVNRVYMERGDLYVRQLGRGYAWFDTGTPNSLLDAGNFVRTLSQRQGLSIACPEEISWRNGWMSDADLTTAARRMGKTDYGTYLKNLLKSNQGARPEGG